MQGVECGSVALRWTGIEDFQNLTFGILAPGDLEELLDVGSFGRHLDRIGKERSDSKKLTALYSKAQIRLEKSQSGAVQSWMWG